MLTSERSHKMEISIFAKKRQSKDGRTFYVYLSTLTKKDGSELPCSVKFNKDITPPKPEDCPCNIIVDKEHCNLSHKNILNPETGYVMETHTLWVNQYAAGSEYVDHSMDDFED